MRCALVGFLSAVLVQTLALNQHDFIAKFCKPWDCINDKIGTKNENGSSYFAREDLELYLNRTLKEAAWGDGIRAAVDSCVSEKKPRDYSKTCPGQELWHCVVDQLVQNCPHDHWSKEDQCTPVSSYVSVKYLFYQSSISRDSIGADSSFLSEPMKNRYTSKCCALPSLFPSALGTCGLETFLKVRHLPHRTTPPPFVPNDELCSTPLEHVDPMECCDTSDLFDSSVFKTCSLKLEWQKEKRLVFDEEDIVTATTESTPESTTRIHTKPDIKVVPQSCTGVTCVFKKLGALTANETIDKAAFSRLLDNMVREHPAWGAARARVLARCLQRDLRMEYEGCDVTKLLACTFDTLSEHCPHAKKGFADPCRHPSHSHNTTTVCQVSMSKYRRTRHQFCDMPRLVPQATLQECGLQTLSLMVTVKREHPQTTLHRYSGIIPMCKSLTNRTTCVLDKLGVLNQYKFMDYTKMMHQLDKSLEHSHVWKVNGLEVRQSARLMPRYTEYCVSTRRLLNVLDAAVTTCPLEKRKVSIQCNNFYKYLTKCTLQKRYHSEAVAGPINRFATLHENFNARKSHVGSPIPTTHVVHRSPSYAQKALVLPTGVLQRPFSLDQRLDANSPVPMFSSVYAPQYMSYAHVNIKRPATVRVYHGIPVVLTNYRSNWPEVDKFRPLEHQFPVDSQHVF